MSKEFQDLYKKHQADLTQEYNENQKRIIAIDREIRRLQKPNPPGAGRSYSSIANEHFKYVPDVYKDHYANLTMEYVENQEVVKSIDREIRMLKRHIKKNQTVTGELSKSDVKNNTRVCDNTRLKCSMSMPFFPESTSLDIKPKFMDIKKK